MPLSTSIHSQAKSLSFQNVRQQKCWHEVHEQWMWLVSIAVKTDKAVKRIKNRPLWTKKAPTLNVGYRSQLKRHYHNSIDANLETSCFYCVRSESRASFVLLVKPRSKKLRCVVITAQEQRFAVGVQLLWQISDNFTLLTQRRVHLQAARIFDWNNGLLFRVAGRSSDHFAPLPFGFGKNLSG